MRKGTEERIAIAKDTKISLEINWLVQTFAPFVIFLVKDGSQLLIKARKFVIETLAFHVIFRP